MNRGVFRPRLLHRLGPVSDDMEQHLLDLGVQAENEKQIKRRFSLRQEVLPNISTFSTRTRIDSNQAF